MLNLGQVSTISQNSLKYVWQFNPPSGERYRNTTTYYTNSMKITRKQPTYYHHSYNPIENTKNKTNITKTKLNTHELNKDKVGWLDE